MLTSVTRSRGWGALCNHEYTLKLYLGPADDGAWQFCFDFVPQTAFVATGDGGEWEGREGVT